MMDGGKAAVAPRKNAGQIKAERRRKRFVRWITAGGRGVNQPPYRKPDRKQERAA